MALTQRKLSCPEESFPKSGNQPLLNVQMIQAICMHGVCGGGGGRQYVSSAHTEPLCNCRSIERPLYKRQSLNQEI